MVVLVPKCSNRLLFSACLMLLLNLVHCYTPRTTRYMGTPIPATIILRTSALPNGTTSLKATEVSSIAVPYTTTTDKIGIVSATTDAIETTTIESRRRIQRRDKILPMFKKWCSVYMAALHERPLLTKATTAAAVSAIGDLISQVLTNYFAGESAIQQSLWALDLTRTLCFSLVGFLYTAPFCHFWYNSVARFGARQQERQKLTQGQRIGLELGLDQSLGVLLYYPLYFYVFELISAPLQGRPFQFLPLTARGIAPILESMKAQYAVWPFSQWFMFRYIPESLRVLHTNMVEILWNIYFCARVAVIASG